MTRVRAQTEQPVTANLRAIIETTKASQRQ